MSFLQRFNLLFLAAIPTLAAVDGAMRVVAKTTDENNFEWVRAWYAPGQVPGNEWTRPFINGTGATTWRAHNLTFYESQWCTQKATAEGMTGSTATAYIARCAGSVQSAIVNWVYSTTADTTYTITFRNSSTPCSGSSTDADCTAAGYDLTEALAHNSSNWDFVMKYAAAGGVTHSQSVRQMLTDGNGCIVYAGPAMTVIDAGWGSGSGPNCTATTTRPYAFGVHKKKVLQSTGSIGASDTTIAIYENPWIAGATMPATAVIRGSVGAATTITINSATSTLLTLSGAVGTGHGQASIYVVDGAATNTSNPSHSGTTMDVTSAAGFSAGDIACARDSCFRIHSIAGNTLTIGTVTLGANKTGWGWYGLTGRAGDSLATGMPIMKYSDIEYYKANSAAQKNLSPRAVLLFVHSRAGVGAHLLTENVWEDRRSGAHLDHTIEIGVGGGTVITTEDKMTLSTFSAVMYPDGPQQGIVSTYVSRGFAWSATTPGDSIVTPNMPWMRAVGAFPLDPSVLADATALNYHMTADQLLGDGQPLPGWDNSSKCDISRSYWGSSRGKIEFDGKWLLDEGQGGSSDNIDWASSHQAFGLLLADKTGVTDYQRWRELVFGSAVCGFHQNVHARSASTSGTWCGSTNNGTTNEPGASCTGGNATLTPFGRHMIPDHRPDFGNNFMGDLSPRVGQMVNLYAYNASYGASHYYNMCDAAYTLTGFPTWRLCFEGNVFGALLTNYAANRPFNLGLTTQGDRNMISWSEKGIAPAINGPRGRARTVMMLGSGCAKLPAGSAAKEAACSKLKNNVAFWEGRAGFTQGNFYSSNTSAYDHSLWRGGWWSSGASATNDGIPVINSPVEACSTSFTEVNNQRSWAIQGMFQFAYFPNTLRWLDMLGLYHGYPLLRHYLRTPVNLILNPTAHNGSGLRIFHSYMWPTESKQPQGTNVTTCAGQPNPATLGTALQWVGSTKWGDYVAAMHADTLNPAASRFYIDLVRDRDWLWLFGMTIDDTVNIEGYSVRHAWQSLRSDLHLSTAAKALTQYGEMPNMLSSPDWYHFPKKIAVTPGTTTATLSFVAPEKAVTCGYAVSSSPIVDPSDSGDTTASIGRREHTFSLTSLTGSTTYHLRLTCKDASETFVGRRHLTFITN